MSVKILFKKRSYGQKPQLVVEGVGHQGRSCETAIKAISDLLGAVRHIDPKPEYYDEQQIVEEQQEHAG